MSRSKLSNTQTIITPLILSVRKTRADTGWEGAFAFARWGRGGLIPAGSKGGVGDILPEALVGGWCWKYWQVDESVPLTPTWCHHRGGPGGQNSGEG